MSQYTITNGIAHRDGGLPNLLPVGYLLYIHDPYEPGDIYVVNKRFDWRSYCRILQVAERGDSPLYRKGAKSVSTYEINIAQLLAEELITKKTDYMSVSMGDTHHGSVYFLD